MPTSTAAFHTLSEESTAKYEGVRKKVAQFIGAQAPESITLPRNATEAVNLVAQVGGERI